MSATPIAPVRGPAHFDLQPILEGELVCIRPIAHSDFEPLYTAASDPLIWQQHPQSDRYKREVFQKFFDTAIESKGAFVLLNRRTGHIIGSSRYCNLKPAESEVEIGWTFLHRAYWGGPYNLELKKLMLDHAFHFVERVVFVAGENNLRSQKALQKIGAKFIGRTVRPGSTDGVKDHVLFAIQRSAWINGSV
jgi:RimJ/RimL family protein N-acetyltransferase